ncbi:MAG: hypothetical protein NTV68_05165 [Methanomicrobiales archaeon]|nr:hypothetical protein [Methanomicrobiales archaeon]
MAVTKTEDKAQDDFATEITQMVESSVFQGERDEFSFMIQKYAEKSQTAEDEGWKLVTRQIVETLPAHLKEGIIVCSLEKINQEGPCRNAAENNLEVLTITPGDNFPCITFPTFYPYLDFILRAGPVDICHMKKTFKVEGSLSLIEAVQQFKENRVQNVSGTILVFAKISLCKGDVAIKLHEFEKEIEVA